MKKLKLKCKMAIFTILVFVVLVPTVTSVALHYFQHRFTATIESQLFTTVSLLSEELDRKIISLHTMVMAIADGVSPEMLNDPRQAQNYLDQRYGVVELFDNGLFLFTVDGKIVAETGIQPSRTGFDLSYRPYIQQTRKTLSPYISDPFISSKPHKHPVVVMTAPLISSEGELSGILAGSIDLMSSNALGSLTNSQVGESGYFYLYTHNRTMVMHPDRTRIMQQDVPVGSNVLYDRALSGFEGAGKTVNSRGLHTLAAFKQLRSVDWILAANLPVAEAFAPVRTGERSAWIIVICGGILIALSTWLAMHRLTRPLLSLTEEIRNISTNHDQRKRVKMNTQDEIGELAESFNGLMSELEQREAELTESQELYQTLSDWSNDWIFWKSAQGKMLYISPAANVITGYSSEQLMNYSEDFEKLVHPDDRDLWQQHQHDADQTKRGSPIDLRIMTKNDDIRWISHICQPVYSDQGHYLGLRGCNTDITERKQIEERLRHLSSRDSLTGLYNRGYFDSEMTRLVPEQDFPVGILVADLDGLKQVNDELGHAAGDRLIRKTSRLLLSAFRTDDVVARIGGDEFAVLMPNINEEGLRGTIQRVRKFEAEHNAPGKDLLLSLSLGAVSITTASSLERALEVADRRMYEDKKQRKQQGQQKKVSSPNLAMLPSQNGHFERRSCANLTTGPQRAERP